MTSPLDQSRNDRENNPLLFSAREFSNHLASISPEEILDVLMNIPIYTWSYIWDDPSIRHMGPMAQDFYAAFNLGVNDESIFHMDGMSVCMASIQALNTMIHDQAIRIEKQQKCIDENANAIAKLEHLLKQRSDS